MMQSAKRRENSMKAIDFMGGDWVLINGTPRKVQAVDGVDNEIMADDELYTLAEDRYHSEDKVEGVPLTEEILQKNFPTPEEIVWWPLKDGSFRVEMQDDTHLIIGKYNYVHELQHALRLFGKEGEIKL